jgi:hypothetical protein
MKCPEKSRAPDVPEARSFVIVHDPLFQYTSSTGTMAMKVVGLWLSWQGNRHTEGDDLLDTACSHNAVTRQAWSPWRSAITSNSRRRAVLLLSLPLRLVR